MRAFNDISITLFFDVDRKTEVITMAGDDGFLQSIRLKNVKLPYVIDLSKSSDLVTAASAAVTAAEAAVVEATSAVSGAELESDSVAESAVRSAERTEAISSDMRPIEACTETLQLTHAFFALSTCRQDIRSAFLNLVNEQHLEILKLFTIRWLCMGECIIHLLKTYTATILAVRQVMENGSGDDSTKAATLLTRLATFESLVMFLFLGEILKRLNSTSRLLQCEDDVVLNPGSISAAFNDLTEYVLEYTDAGLFSTEASLSDTPVTVTIEIAPRNSLTSLKDFLRWSAQNYAKYGQINIAPEGCQPVILNFVEFESSPSNIFRSALLKCVKSMNTFSTVMAEELKSNFPLTIPQAFSAFQPANIPENISSLETFGHDAISIMGDIYGVPKEIVNFEDGSTSIVPPLFEKENVYEQLRFVSKKLLSVSAEARSDARASASASEAAREAVRSGSARAAANRDVGDPGLRKTSKFTISKLFSDLILLMGATASAIGDLISMFQVRKFIEANSIVCQCDHDCFFPGQPAGPARGLRMLQ